MSKQKYEALIEEWVKSHNEYVYYERDCMAFIDNPAKNRVVNYLISHVLELKIARVSQKTI